MDQTPLFEELVRVLAEAGIEVREEPFEQPSKNAGGLCRFHDKTLVFLDANASRPEQQRALLEAVEAVGLSELGLDGLTLSPALLRALSRRGCLPWPRRVGGPAVARGKPKRRS